MRKAHFICLLQIIIACAGLYFSLRQLWLQSLPAGQAPACMPGLDILMRYFPWETIAKALFWGSGDCGEDVWHMLGISMPGWAAMYFFFMVVMGFVLYLGTRKIQQ